MGAYAYCRTCLQGLDAPTVREAALDSWECPACGTPKEVEEDALANALTVMEERIARLEELILHASGSKNP